MMQASDFDSRFGSARRAWVLNAFGCGLAAFESDDNYRGLARRDHTFRTICSARHEHIVAVAKRTLDEVTGIRHCMLNGKEIFVIEDFALLAFNLLDDKHLPRGNRTFQSFRWLNQRAMRGAPTLDDMPLNPLNVVAGYTVTELLRPKDFWMICPDGRENIWEMGLSEPAMSSIFDAIQPVAPKSPELPFRVREDEESGKEEKNDGTDESMEHRA